MTDVDKDRLGVVFVHGFLSSPETWNAITSLSADDPQLKRMDALPFAYESRLWQFDPRRRTPTLKVVADMLKEYLDSKAEHHRQLVLVGHSQGGLVIQYCLSRMLTEGRGRDLARIRRVVLFACPNSGTQWGAAVRRGLLQGNVQEKDLRPLNTEITEARRIIMRDVVAAKDVTERTCPIPFAVFAGETDNIVPPASAQDVFPEVSVLPGDHNGIIRPDSAEHLTYVALRRHLVLSLAAAEPPSTPGGDTPGKAPGSPREPSPDAPPSPGGTDAEAPQAPPTNGIPRLTARAARVLGGGHTTGIHLARFTADGGRLATFAARRPTALLWDLSGPRPAGGTLLEARYLASGPNYREYRRLVTDAVFSPDGTMLVTAVDMRPGPEQFRGKKLRLWDPATRWSIGEPLRVTNMAVVSALAFSPMNDLLAVAMAAGPIRLWNPRQRRMIRALRPGAQSDVMAFSPDGRTLAATEQRGTLIRLWDVESGKSTAQPLVGHSVFVRGIVFSADGSLLATRSDDRTVRVWDTREGAMVALLRTEPRAFVTAFAFARGGHHLLTALTDGRIVGWDARTGARQGEDLRVDGDVADMVFTPAGHLLAVTGGAAPMLYEWEPAAEGTV